MAHVKKLEGITGRPIMNENETNTCGQTLICKTSVLSPQYHPRPEHLPKIYVWVMRCSECGFVYGANNCDAWLRKCPRCQGGKPGFDLSFAGRSNTKSHMDCVRENKSGISRLLEIMRRLRDPNTGCPWDIEQDFKSIAHHAIEEAYEVCDAIERGEWNELKDELGDLLFQTVFHAQMAEEKELFSFNDIANAIADKMVKRHPHVFGDESREKSAERQMRDWESAKASERQSNARTGALDDVAIALPSLLRAIKLQKRAARVGFDWPCAKNVVKKISEEAEELLAEIDADEDGRVEEELGDLLFSIANFARHLNIDPEQALRRANSKFESRFKRMENIVQDLGMNIEDATLGELDELWNRAKKDEKRRPKNP